MAEIDRIEDKSISAEKGMIAKADTAGEIPYKKGRSPRQGEKMDNIFSLRVSYPIIKKFGFILKIAVKWKLITPVLYEKYLG